MKFIKIAVLAAALGFTFNLFCAESHYYTPPLAQPENLTITLQNNTQWPIFLWGVARITNEDNGTVICKAMRIEPNQSSSVAVPQGKIISFRGWVNDSDTSKPSTYYVRKQPGEIKEISQINFSYDQKQGYVVQEIKKQSLPTPSPSPSNYLPGSQVYGQQSHQPSASSGTYESSSSSSSSPTYFQQQQQQLALQRQLQLQQLEQLQQQQQPSTGNQLSSSSHQQSSSSQGTTQTPMVSPHPWGYQPQQGADQQVLQALQLWQRIQDLEERYTLLVRGYRDMELSQLLYQDDQFVWRLKDQYRNQLGRLSSEQRRVLEQQQQQQQKQQEQRDEQIMLKLKQKYDAQQEQLEQELATSNLTDQEKRERRAGLSIIQRGDRARNLPERLDEQWMNAYEHPKQYLNLSDVVQQQGQPQPQQPTASPVAGPQQSTTVSPQPQQPMAGPAAGPTVSPQQPQQQQIMGTQPLEQLKQAFKAAVEAKKPSSEIIKMLNNALDSGLLPDDLQEIRYDVGYSLLDFVVKQQDDSLVEVVDWLLNSAGVNLTYYTKINTKKDSSSLAADVIDLFMCPKIVKEFRKLSLLYAHLFV